jgi:flagellar hook protein FlgE
VGILSAMNKSVGGLNAQSFALENISGNIANSQTTAFKRTDTSFQDLVGAGTSRVALMAAGNVRASARSTVGVQGAIEGSAIETFMGIKGNGFFVVKQKAGEVDGSTVFGTGMAYTRRGDFQLDKEGYLVNGAGYYLSGLPIDRSTNNPVGDTPDVLQVTKQPIAAEKTTRVEYRLNLPTEPLTTFARENPTLTDPEIWATSTTPARDGPPAGGVVDGDLKDEFIENSISGGAVTVYDSLGNPINVQLRWAKTANNEWQLYYQNDAAATGTDPAWTRIDVATGNSGFNFKADGTIDTALDDIAELALPDLTIAGQTIEDVTLSFSTGLTQFADTSGSANVRQLTQDGVPAGNFLDVSITDGGRVVANYSNGKTVDLFQIPLVSFAGETQLKPMDGGAYAETKGSGPAVTNAPGLVVGAALENSNVDIGEEFTKLIVTQQAFSANSKVISTADQMMTSVLNIIR